ncbi:hypothetical protein [Neisseria wadsworthii]|uniref:hypothetical protein n=1 Tax=Neisseria wadsworthii TaxID=607711 RepID=UPI001F30CBD7|nr:hypothetical protein [Neisseria wadsworthii]
MDLTLWHYLAIATLGILASIINILAGGGSNLILPLLMAFGVPPDIANASNRVGIFFSRLPASAGLETPVRCPRTICAAFCCRWWRAVWSVRCWLRCCPIKF